MLVGMAWDGMGWGGMRWETMTWHAGELPGKLRGEAEEAGESELAGKSREAGLAYFSSQAATRKGSDDSQKAQPAALRLQTSSTNAGDRSEEKRREHKHNCRTTPRTEHQNLSSGTLVGSAKFPL